MLRKIFYVMAWVGVDAVVLGFVGYQMWEYLPHAVCEMKQTPLVDNRVPASAGKAIDNLAQSMVSALKPMPRQTQATDFSLPSLRDETSVRLTDLTARKPVVLLLGSFTCDVFCDQVKHLEILKARYGDAVHFQIVVVREAGHRLPGLEFLLEKSRGREQRRTMVARALEIKKVTIPAALDTDDGAVEKAYAAWPLRLVVIDKAGRIDFSSDFRQPTAANIQRVDEWLQQHAKTTGSTHGPLPRPLS